MIKINFVASNFLDANTYIVYDENSNEAVIIDPGGEVGAILQVINSKKLHPKFIMYTHLHFDHYSSGLELSEELEIPSYANKLDMFLLERHIVEMYTMSKVELPKIDGFFKDGDELKFENQVIKVIHTPGHSFGSSCFFITGHLFTGDTILGKSNFYDHEKDNSSLLKSIMEKLLVLPENTIIYPGHGNLTTIKEEKQILLKLNLYQ